MGVSFPWDTAVVHYPTTIPPFGGQMWWCVVGLWVSCFWVECVDEMGLNMEVGDVWMLLVFSF